MESPQKIYLTQLMLFATPTISSSDNDVEYIHKDAFIEKACDWLKDNITNNPNCTRVISRKGTITMGELIGDFKKYMEGK